MNRIDIYLTRHWFTNQSTIGILSYEDHECYSLEDKVREIEGRPVVEWKVYGRTAIPVGRYRLIRNFSPRFKVVLPLLENVPGFTGIRIHPGNSADDTEGCILLGYGRDSDYITQSRPAFKDFDDWLKDVLKKEYTVLLNIE
jgi:hypothetical protein